MNTSRLFAVILISIILLITHSYFKRGFRLTFNFFLFALIAATRKEVGSFFSSGVVALKKSPFFFPESSIPFIVSFLTVIFGWAFTFYLAWSISEKIMKRLDYFNNKIFPTLLFAGIIAASISYAVEVVGVDMGWWRWKFYDGRFSSFLIGNTHFFAIEAWFYFAIHFLLVYFLIECSKFRNTDWKCVFFLVFFIRTWTIVIPGSPVIFQIMEQHLMLCLVIALSFLAPLKFEFTVLKSSKRIAPLSHNLIDFIPFLVVSNLLVILSFLSIFKIKNIHLLISLLPLFILVLLAIKRVRLMTIILFCTCLLMWGGRLIVPAIIPVVLFIIFKSLEKVMPCYQSS